MRRECAREYRKWAGDDQDASAAVIGEREAKPARRACSRLRPFLQRLGDFFFDHLRFVGFLVLQSLRLGIEPLTQLLDFVLHSGDVHFEPGGKQLPKLLFELLFDRRIGGAAVLHLQPANGHFILVLGDHLSGEFGILAPDSQQAKHRRAELTEHATKCARIVSARLFQLCMDLRKMIGQKSQKCRAFVRSPTVEEAVGAIESPVIIPPRGPVWTIAAQAGKSGRGTFARWWTRRMRLTESSFPASS